MKGKERVREKELIKVMNTIKTTEKGRDDYYEPKTPLRFGACNVNCTQNCVRWHWPRACYPSDETVFGSDFPLITTPDKCTMVLQMSLQVTLM